MAAKTLEETFRDIRDKVRAPASVKKDTLKREKKNPKKGGKSAVDDDDMDGGGASEANRPREQPPPTKPTGAQASTGLFSGPPEGETGTSQASGTQPMGKGRGQPLKGGGREEEENPLGREERFRQTNCFWGLCLWLAVTISSLGSWLHRGTGCWPLPKTPVKKRCRRCDCPGETPSPEWGASLGIVGSSLLEISSLVSLSRG